MADHQTTGGYPRIGQVATVDLPLLAQASPGHSITFQKIPLREAQHLYILEEKKIQLIREILRVKATSSLLI
jgi:antagonist of KipI